MSDSDPSARELREKYQALLAENGELREKIGLLKARLRDVSLPAPDRISQNTQGAETAQGDQARELLFPSLVNNSSEADEKVGFFLSLFKGRDDVYARRWENRKKETSGYSPYCINEWKRGLCAKPKVKCAACGHKAYASFDEKAVEEHLRGNIVAGVYPMLPDETCRFLAIDLDEEEWRKDVAALRQTAFEHAIPLAVERSRSGNGAHAWIFFETPLSAVVARKFGTALLTGP
jgi:hypothetical protein